MFVAEYTYLPSHAALRDEHRPAHRAWLLDGYEAGRVLSVGAYPDGTGALVIVRADDAGAAAELLSHDPFARAGAIGGTRLREWNCLYGPFTD